MTLFICLFSFFMYNAFCNTLSTCLSYIAGMCVCVTYEYDVSRVRPILYTFRVCAARS